MRILHYQHDQLGNEFVKEGFCWPGFFFTVAWAFYVKLWALGLATIIFATLMGALIEFVSNYGYPRTEIQLATDKGRAYVLLYFGIMAFFGFAGNTFRANDLQKSRYKFVQEFRSPLGASKKEMESAVKKVKSGG